MFSIPYTKTLTKTLNKIKDKNQEKLISDIYFSDGLYPSARNIKLSKTERDELQELSKDFNLNYTFNPEFYSNSFYLEKEFKDFLSNLEYLKDFYNLKYITMNNTILLKNKILRDKLEELDINIRLSVNNNIDSLEKLKIIVEDFYIKDIVLDRSLNRNLDELLKIYEYNKSLDFKLNLVLLVNEGCLPNCPYKKYCDQMISQYYNNTDEEVNILSLIHDQLTCTNDFYNKPELNLKSPFISPIYIDFYKKYNFNFKIAGRNKDRNILEKIILSYIQQVGDQSLQYFFSTFTPNQFKKINFYELEEFNFLENTKNCKLQCHSCDYCDKVYKELICH